MGLVQRILLGARENLGFLPLSGPQGSCAHKVRPRAAFADRVFAIQPGWGSYLRTHRIPNPAWYRFFQGGGGLWQEETSLL